MKARIRRQARVFLGVLATGLMSACGSPAFQTPQTPIPGNWETPNKTGPSVANQPWEQVFPIPELQALVEEALTNNTDILVAAQRVSIAGSQYGVARSVIFPSLNANASLLRQRAPGINPNANSVSEAASVGLLSASWEIDIWGKLQDQSDAARSQYLASAAFYQGAQISLAAQVATLYLELLDLDNQIRISRQTVESRRKGLRINEVRFAEEIAPSLDVYQAESLLASAEQILFDQERRLQLTENALSTLLGRNPGPIVRTTTLKSLQMPANLYAGIPSELLARRPDILGAEESLRAAAANVSAAKKEYLPSLSLTTAIGLASPALGSLFQSGRYAWSMQPGISTNLFSAGRIGFGVDIAESEQEILVQQYKSTIRTAFTEVNDALINIEQRGLEKNASERVVKANLARVRASNARYLTGIAPFFEVLDAERQLLESQIVLSQVERAHYQAAVELYRALGGGWQRTDFKPIQIAAPI